MHLICDLWKNIFTILHFLLEQNFLVFTALLSDGVMLSVSAAVLVVLCVCLNACVL